MNNNSKFFARAFAPRGPKFWYGFSRPFYHNLVGLLHGHRFDKQAFGGMLRHSEGAMLYRWASMLPKNGTIVEIGCYGGLSTCYLALGARQSGAHVIAIDPFQSDLALQRQRGDGCVDLDSKPTRAQVEERIRQAGLAAHVTLIEGFSEDVVAKWSRPVDFLWIDGNHDQTYRDYSDWAGVLKATARLAIHDAHPRYGLPGVAEAAQRIFSAPQWHRLEHVKSIISGVRHA